jgi:adenosylcobinamide kinase/adenosylcobinamide-phosphate guanylyltransferase
MVLVDSLGTWVANGLELEASEWEERQGDFLAFLGETALDLVLVAEETGWGLVPPYPLGRRFRDRLGALTRRVGSAADQVYLVVGGYALDLSRWGEPLPLKD